MNTMLDHVIMQEIESKHNMPKASDAKNNKEVIYQLVSHGHQPCGIAARYNVFGMTACGRTCYAYSCAG